MTKSERAKAFSDLEHALNATADWNPDVKGGPAVIARKARENGLFTVSFAARQAYALSAHVASEFLGVVEPEPHMAAMRKLAPVMLAILLGDE